jgi:LacI family transcriptional regulator
VLHWPAGPRPDDARPMTTSFRRPTMREVAQTANVSISTVSRVMSDHPDVREETRTAVQKIIDSMGYRPSVLARGLVLKRTNSLGLLVSDITNPFYPQLAKGIEHAASARGWVVIIGNTDRESSRTEWHVDAMLERAVDGIIFGSTTSHDRAVPRLLEAGYPLVLVNRRHPSAEASSVLADNLLGAQIATHHLAALGHRRIGHIAGPDWAANAVDRESGYVRALTEAGLPLDAELISRDEFSIAGGARAARRLLATADRPTALFATNDMMALGALEAIRDLGLRCPDDVAVVGFDDIELAGSRLIELSTVSHRIYDMGTRAVDILLDQIIAGPPEVPVQELLEPKLIIRRTCGA